MNRRHWKLNRSTWVWILAIALAGAIGVTRPLNARGDDQSSSPAGANAVARRWFEDAKFGLFVHWGVYSLLGKGECVMNNDKLPISEYQKLPPRFNPVKFDADEWVRLAKAAGMKYITITSKHHDGFCMYDSSLTAYDIVDATPYGKDPMKALASACHKQGIKLFFYYSLLDWHHPDYFPRGKTGQTAGREEKGDWKTYVAYYQGQVRELCSKTTARLAESGSTAGGTVPRPTGIWPGLTGSFTSFSPERSSATITMSPRSPARISRCSSRTCQGRTRPASTRPA